MAGKKPDFSVPRLIVDCAHEGCKTPAILREKRPTGWANLCEFHYIEDHRERAKKWCESQGLYTTQQKIEYCRRMAGTVLKPMPDREPGQDDEELAA